MATIACFNPASETWSESGEMKQARMRHNVIYNGEDFIVVGGEARMATETCTLKNNKFQCVEHEPTLDLYRDYPELFLVEDSFCS